MKFSTICLAIAIPVLAGSSCIPDMQNDRLFSNEVDSPLDSSAEPSTHQNMEDEMPQDLIPAEIEPLPNQSNRAALALQRLGFRILHIGPTISVQARRSLWESTFNVSFKEERKIVIAEIESEETYLKAESDDLIIPEELESLISEVMFVEPPEFFN